MEIFEHFFKGINAVLVPEYIGYFFGALVAVLSIVLLTFALIKCFNDLVLWMSKDKNDDIQD